jgi:hypothetical protein
MRANSFPIYIVSKGRWESRLTNKALARMGVRHFVIVEEQEAANYRAHLENADVLILDPRYKAEYELCDDLGLAKSTGPGPARNFAWDHAVASGAAWHWVMDDNINGFFRLNFNLKTPCETPAVFAAMESFVLRYTNVAMAGPNYFMFASRKTVMPAFVTNTRIYSCNLIRNDAPFRWRGRYNEDTDLSLRMLKAEWCTIQFNAFLQYKMPTQQLGGGNTAEFYALEGTRPKSEMLAQMHPDVATVVEKFGRVHHHVDYSRWKTMPLKRREGLPVLSGVDNFGMRLEQKIDGVWKPIDRPRSVAKKAAA